MILGTWASHVTVLRVFGLELVGTVFSAPAVKVAMNVELSVMFARQTSWRGEEPGRSKSLIVASLGISAVCIIEFDGSTPLKCF